MSTSLNTPRTILGLDPGFERIGYGFIECTGPKDQLLSYGCITTPKNIPFAERLNTIGHELEALLSQYKPAVAGIEKLFFFNNAKTAIDVSQARGVLLLTLVRAAIPIIELTPLQVKQATTGFGAADKKQVGHMVATLLKLPEIPKPDDAADALAVALCASRMNPSLLTR